MILALLILNGPTAAQDEPLVTDRPDFTESAETIVPGRFQIESGLTRTDVDDELEVTTYGEVLARIGLTPSLELRVAPGSYLEQEGSRPSDDVSGFEDASVGFKLRLRRDGDDRVATPALALLASTSLPTGDRELRESSLQPGAVLAAAWDLSDRWSLGSNLGWTWASSDAGRFGELSASVAVGLGVTDRLGLYAELYGFQVEQRGGPDTSYANAGLTWLFSNDLQLDLRVGGGLDSEGDDLFAGIGLSWRH